MCAIKYNKQKMKLHKSNHFFKSLTPVERALCSLWNEMLSNHIIIYLVRLNRCFLNCLLEVNVAEDLQQIEEIISLKMS